MIITIIIIDAGLKFPDLDMSGVDYIVSDLSYLLQKRKNIKALFLTYGHEDHIGGIPYLLKQLPTPIWVSANILTKTYAKP
ncbi:MBL fold metallo-hydrolase [Paenibacillus peoriae]|uniref:MBL fold metallo-hydrolase n=1 Tax=Paenibacillus peoriae TaxID=59893 RepID=UPI003F99ECD6